MHSSTTEQNVRLQQQPRQVPQQHSHGWEHSNKTDLIRNDFHPQAQGNTKGMLPGSQWANWANLSASFLHVRAILSYHISALPLHVSENSCAFSWISLQSFYLLDLPNCAASEMLVDRTGYRVGAAEMWLWRAGLLLKGNSNLDTNCKILFRASKNIFWWNISWS